MRVSEKWLKTEISQAQNDLISFSIVLTTTDSMCQVSLQNLQIVFHMHLHPQRMLPLPRFPLTSGTYENKEWHKQSIFYTEYNRYTHYEQYSRRGIKTTCGDFGNHILVRFRILHNDCTYLCVSCLPEKN